MLRRSKRSMTLLGGAKPTLITQLGHEVINPEQEAVMVPGQFVTHCVTNLGALHFPARRFNSGSTDQGARLLWLRDARLYLSGA